MTRAAPRRRAEKPRRGRRSEAVVARTGRTDADTIAVARTPAPGVVRSHTAAQPRPVEPPSVATPGSPGSADGADSADNTITLPVARGSAGVAELVAAEPRQAEPTPVRSRFLDGLRLGSLVVLWLVVLAAGGAGLAAQGFGLGPSWVGGAGAVAIAVAYTWALGARVGGRPAIFAALALVLGAATVVAHNDEMCTGAAVLVAALGAVLAVMVTAPARRFAGVVRESVVAIVIAGIGGLAALGFEPVLTVSRFQYAVLACALVCAFFLVYRLGAGLHGLGRRGVLVVAVGGVMLIITLFYAEMIRRYATPGLVNGVHDWLAWCRDHLGGYPRPMEALLGIPALAWGTHMRARRRQGWWVCLFGVALTAPVAATLANPDLGVIEAALGVGYSLVVGLLIGFVIIRLDVALTGGRASSVRNRVGRRAVREADDASAVRPEPRRVRALL